MSKLSFPLRIQEDERVRGKRLAEALAMLDKAANLPPGSTDI